MFLALIIYSVIVFQCDFKQETPQPATIDQRNRNINKSKEDSLKTVRANILLNQKDSTIVSTPPSTYSYFSRFLSINCGNRFFRSDSSVLFTLFMA